MRFSSNPTHMRWLKLLASLALATWLLLRVLPVGAQDAPPADSALQIEELRDRIVASPTDGALHTQLGILYVQETLYEDARQSFISALQCAPTDPASHMNLGLVLLRMERWEDAKPFLANYAHMRPTDADGYLRQGEAFEGAGDLEGARKIWFDGSQSDGMPSEDRIRLVQRCAKSHADREEWSDVDRIVRSDEDFLNSSGAAELRTLAGIASLQLAHAARDSGEIKVALEHYQHAREMRPLDTVAYRAPIELLLENWRIDEAATIADEASMTLVGSGAAAFFQGRIAEERGDLQRAADMFHDAVRLDPEFPGAYAKLGTVLASLGDAAGAAAALEQAIRRGEGGAAVAYNMGVVLSQKGQYREAIPYFTTALEADPSNKDVYRALGQACIKVEDHERTADVYQRLVDRFGPDPRDLFQLAAAQALLDRHKEACDNYKVALGLETGTSAAHVNYAISLAKLERFGDALEQFQASLALEPENELAQFNIALCHQKLGNYTAAIENYEIALAMKETYRSYVNMATCFKALEDKENSDYYFAKATELQKGGG